MLIVGMVIVLLLLLVILGLAVVHWRAVSSSLVGPLQRLGQGSVVALLAFATGASLLLTVATAQAAIVPTVDLGTAEGFSVLGGETVTNTGDSVLANSVGVSPGTAIVGFPPGVVQPPGTIEEGTPVAAQAQADSTAAYLDALGRPLDETTTSDLTGLTLVGGVYAGPSKSPLTLNGALTLDGAGDPNSVFIFQTDSTLITGAGSTVLLINGAQPCNVFWQVGSSATLGTGSTFVGNILALTTVTLEDSVTVQGRALAQTGEVTLINDTFTQVPCDMSQGTTTTVGVTTTIAATTTAAGDLPLTGRNSAGILLLGLGLLAVGMVVGLASRGPAKKET
jgi:hypothetical protein